MSEEKKMKFEDALLKLETIVKEMEDGNNLSLDDMLERFEKGRKLEQYCITELNSIRTKIEKVTQSGALEPLTVNHSDTEIR
jgi:exodeoxyribonuclease VII small subunit